MNKGRIAVFFLVGEALQPLFRQTNLKKAINTNWQF